MLPNKECSVCTKSCKKRGNVSNNLQTIINPTLQQIFTQETPKGEIRTRQGRGGRLLLYTDGAYVIKTLNQAFGWNWDFDTDQAEVLYVGERPFEVKCRGRLTVRVGETTIFKVQYGCQPIEILKDGSAPVSLGDAFKGAATDALKKCASLLGIALDLYDSDSEINTANPQQVQKEIQQAKQQAKAPVVIEQPKPAPTPDTAPPRQTEPLNLGGSAVVNSPQSAIEAAHRQIGQTYYNAPTHAYNALRQELGAKWAWPKVKPLDEKGWVDVVGFLVYHAKTQLSAARQADENIEEVAF